MSSRGIELLESLTVLQHQIRLLEADLLGVVAEVDREGIAGEAGYSTTRALLAQVLHVTPQRATKLIHHAVAVTEELTPTGHTTPAPLPAVREAWRDGAIDRDHIEVIADIVKRLPTWASVRDREIIETTLADTARTESPRVVRTHGEILLARLDQDGHQPNQEERLAQPRNLFRYSRTPEGRMVFRGELEPEIAETFENLLLRHSKPRPEDPRTTPERYGDAVGTVVEHAAHSTTVSGRKPRLVVTMDVNTLTDALATATLESGAPLSPSAARRLACDAEIIPLVLNTRSVTVDAGRSRRLVTDRQRQALAVRDKGCAMPDCTAPVAFTDAHHVRHWVDGGPTDLANLVLLCGAHHRLLHHAEWKVRIRNGIPELIPPRWIDPEQKPLRNTLRS